MCSKILKTKAELFHLQKILEQNQNVLICSRIF